MVTQTVLSVKIQKKALKSVEKAAKITKKTRNKFVVDALTGAAYVAIQNRKFEIHYQKIKDTLK